MNQIKFFLMFGITFVNAIIFVPNAFSYIGPGAGISAIGTVIAFIAAILLAIVGFVWYPIKRLLAKMKAKNNKKIQ